MISPTLSYLLQHYIAHQTQFFYTNSNCIEKKELCFSHISSNPWRSKNIQGYIMLQAQSTVQIDLIFTEKTQKCVLLLNENKMGYGIPQSQSSVIKSLRELIGCALIPLHVENHCRSSRLSAMFSLQCTWLITWWMRSCIVKRLGEDLLEITSLESPPIMDPWWEN